MRRIISTSDRRAFTLLEVTVVLIILTILTSAAIPTLTQVFLNKAENKVGLDINAIEDAALAYYVKNNSWPTSITPTGVTPATDLESNGFLPSGWNALNPFGYPYTASVNGSVFNVTTQVVNGSQIVIINQLPTSSYSGNMVSSSVPVPGVASSGFGAWVQQSVGTIYQAATDGFVVAYNLVNNNNDLIYAYTDSNPNPSTLRAIAGTASGANGRGPYGYGGQFPLMMPVRKGDYYLVTTPGFSTATMYFLSA